MSMVVMGERFAENSKRRTAERTTTWSGQKAKKNEKREAPLVMGARALRCMFPVDVT
jgi:hypothetical protein